MEQQIEAWLLEQSKRLFIASPDFDDPESVHRMRVASRRLRVGLRLLGVRRVPSLARLGRALGAVRTLDVSLALLREAPVRSRSLEQRLRRERRQRLAQLRRVYERTEPVVWSGRRANLRRALAELRRLVRKRLARFEERRSGGAFHKLRIAVKKYRYGLEAVGAADRIKPLKRLQELMGDCHDVEVLLKGLPAGPLRQYFEKERKRRRAAVQKFLDGHRRWVEKVKLDYE